MDPLGLLSPEVMESIVVEHPWHFIIWTAIVFFLGYQLGKRRSGSVTFYGLSKRQRSLLSHIASDSGEKLEIDSDILYLVDHELIAEEHGYDVDARCLPKRFVITAKGERMLKFHPMWRKVK